MKSTSVTGGLNKEGKNESTSTTANASTSAEGDASKAGKKAKKSTYEKQLEDINKELSMKASVGSGVPNAWKGVGIVKKVKLKAEQEQILLEQKCCLLLKLKRNKEVVEDGYSILGRMGPLPVIYKCILIALTRLGRNEDDLVELLDTWRKASPKCSQMLETRRIFDGYLTALRSGVKYADIFSGVEEAIGLNASFILSKSIEGVEESKWRFRAPPHRHTAFSLCPRSTTGNSCLYGDECLFAHSTEELKEWKMRVGDKNSNAPGRSVEEIFEEKDPTRVATSALSSTSTSTAGKKLQIPPMYRNLLIPPLCVHYLTDLGKKIRETVEIKKILTDEIPGVTIKSSSLNLQRRIDGTNKVEGTWSFAVTSKMPMGTVTILHDANRECFEVSSAIYYNKKKESLDLIELHPNNKVQTKLQVLNTFIQPALFLRFNTGWPEFCYYKIDIRFESFDRFPDPGTFRQSLVFDFKKDPKVVKHISIDILPKVEPIGSHLSDGKLIANKISTKSVWGVTPPLVSPVDSNFNEYTREDPNSNDDFGSSSSQPQPKSFSPIIEPIGVGFTTRRSDFPSLTQCVSAPSVKVDNVKPNPKNQNVEKAHSLTKMPVDPEAVVDSETGAVILIKGVPLHETWTALAQNKEINLSSDDEELTRSNYCSMMQHFLDKELLARRALTFDFKKSVQFKILREFSSSPDCLVKYQSKIGEVYGQVSVFGDMFASNPKLERMILENCYNIIISNSEEKDTSTHSSFRMSNRKFYCQIIEKSKSGFVVAIGRNAADELLLLSNTTRQLNVQFVLDSLYMDRLKCCLEGLTPYHLDILFPNFNCALPFLKVIDGVGMQGKEELTLNYRQLDVYNLLIGRKELIQTDTQNVDPPILLLGGVSTGKSYLIAHCIAGLFRTYYSSVPSRRILLCTHSNFTSDRFISKFWHDWLISDRLSVQKAKPLRIYDEACFVDGVSGVVKHYCVFDDDGSNFRYPTKEEVLAHRLIITTFSSCAELIRLGFDGDTFSHIILDEVNLGLEAECVQPLVLAGKETKVLLAGDLFQPQLQIFSTENKKERTLSLLQRLHKAYPFRHPFVAALVVNYEHHEVILKFLNEVLYHGDPLQQSKKNIPAHPKYYPFTFHHINACRELQAEDSRGCFNMEEILQIVQFVEDLIKTWPQSWGEDSARDKNSIAVFTPYHSQVVALKIQLQLKGIHSVSVKLLSNISGKKYRVVILSTVRSYKQEDVQELDDAADGGFYTDKDLLIQAVTCAKSLVAGFGDVYSLWNLGRCKQLWQRFLTECHRNRSLIKFYPQGGKILQAEDGAIIGLPASPPRQIPPLMSLTGLARKDSFKAAPIPEKKQTTLLHTPNISPSHGMNLTGLSLEDSADDFSSWTTTASLNMPPKTDLFSAFYSSPTGPALYTSASQINLSNFGPGTATSTSKQQQLDIDKTICRPVALNGVIGPPKNSLKESIMGEKNHLQLEATVNKNLCSNKLEVYRTPFQLPSVSPTSILEELPLKLNDTQRRSTDLTLSTPPTAPTVTPPSFFGDHNRQFYRNSLDPVSHPTTSTPLKSLHEVDSFMENNLDSSFLSPLQLTYRGPPGFAPITPPTTTETKLEDLSVNSIYYQQKGLSGSVGMGSYLPNKLSYKRNNTYELPPRMLKHLNSLQTNYRTPTPNRSKTQPFYKAIAAPPAAEEMNFFEELGLTSQDPGSHEVERCASCSTSNEDDAQSLILSDETSSIPDDGDSNNTSSGNVSGAGGKNGWIEVKRNSKKSKRRMSRRAKNKAKLEFNRALFESTTADENDFDVVSESTIGKNGTEMKMDDKIEIITQMGFNTTEAIDALQASGKDLQGAVDWLISKTT